jgi:ERCC4-type nuclease
MITIDDREVTQHPEIRTQLQVPHRVERMDSGDYAFLDRNSEPLGIERCEIGNFVQKIRSGELEEQMYRCQDNYANVVLLVEAIHDDMGGLLAVYKDGNRGYFRTHVYPHTTYDFVEAVKVRMSELGIEVFETPNFACSMRLISIIYEQRTKPESAHTLFKRTRIVKMPTKLTNNPNVSRLMSIVPRLSEKTAIGIIHKYGNIWNVIHADEKDILTIDGVGKGTLIKIKECIGKP